MNIWGYYCNSCTISYSLYVLQYLYCEDLYFWDINNCEGEWYFKYTSGINTECQSSLDMDKSSACLTNSGRYSSAQKRVWRWTEASVRDKETLFGRKIIDDYGRTSQKHIERGCFLDPKLDCYNMAFPVQNVNKISAFWIFSGFSDKGQHDLDKKKILNDSWASGAWKLRDLFINPLSSSNRFNSHATAVNVSRIFLILFGQSRWFSPFEVETSFQSTFSYELRFTFKISNALMNIFVIPFSNSSGSFNNSCKSFFACLSSFKQKFRGKFFAEGFYIVEKIPGIKRNTRGSRE